MFAQLKPMNLRTSNFERRLPCWWPSYSKPRARAPPIGFVFISIFFYKYSSSCSQLKPVDSEKSAESKELDELYHHINTDKIQTHISQFILHFFL